MHAQICTTEFQEALKPKDDTPVNETSQIGVFKNGLKSTKCKRKYQL